MTLTWMSDNHRFTTRHTRKSIMYLSWICHPCVIPHFPGMERTGPTVHAPVSGRQQPYSTMSFHAYLLTCKTGSRIVTNPLGTLCPTPWAQCKTPFSKVHRGSGCVRSQLFLQKGNDRRMIHVWHFHDRQATAKELYKSDNQTHTPRAWYFDTLFWKLFPIPGTVAREGMYTATMRQL